jgi:hypothetical protein
MTPEERQQMTRLVALAILAAVSTAGCATIDSPAASPAFTPQAECERNGGWWRTSMNFCEYQSPGMPER